MKHIWENPEIQGVNRVPMSGIQLHFPSAKAALQDAFDGPETQKRENNPNYLCLDGSWRFNLLDNPCADEQINALDEQSPNWTLPDFFKSPENSKNWADIKVPGTWTLQGWDKPHYTNVQMPFEATPPAAPKHNPTGLYRRTFVLPLAWKGKRVVLHVGSAESCCLVYVNGVFAGAGKDTRLPSEYDVTELAQEGENTLCLKVVRYSDASYVEDQDQWWFGGIHRSVYLYATEEVYFKDAWAVGNIDGLLNFGATIGGKVPEGRSTGNVPVNVSLDAKPFDIVYRLYAWDALNTPLHEGKLSLTCNYRLNSNSIQASVSVLNPRLWSSEQPNLYILTLTLCAEGRELESVAFCTGFRSVEVKNRELLINRKKVYIKGVNRHEHDEHTGKTLSTEAMLRDIQLLKSHNFNAVRTCHYPNDERWYDLCDRYGVYLVDEANIENHCFYNQLCEDTAWTHAYTARVQRMVERDRNHPSIIMWSLGNESGDGASHAACAAWVHRADPSRVVNYEGAVRPKGGQGGFTLDSLGLGRGLTDIISPMYPAISLITDFAKYREDDRPLIMIEYSHAMGNSNGSLADYWKAIESHHGLQGGFIWDWIDQGIAAKSATGVKYWKYGGDFGDEPSDFDFCLNGLLFPDQTPKPAMAECRQVFAPVRLTPVADNPYSFIVENRCDFSTLDHLELRWELRNSSIVPEKEVVLAKGCENLDGIAPGETRKLTLNIGSLRPFNSYNGTAYLHADFCLKRDVPWGKAGLVVAQGERVLHEVLLTPFRDVKAGEPQAVLPRFTPNLFRVPTENDGLKTYSHLLKDPAAAFYYQDKPFYAWLNMDLLHIRLEDELDQYGSYTADIVAGERASNGFENRKLGLYTCISTEEPDGELLDITFDFDPTLPELPRVGISAKVPATYTSVRWFGRGPEESYPDRLAGVFLGVHTQSIAELETPYIVPQENGNRSEVRILTLTGAGVPPLTIATEATPFNFSVSRYAPENMLAALHTVELKDTTRGKDGYFLLNIDAAQRGVGTATCGPDTLEQYRVWPKVFKLSLFICG
jgi:beta-galactosidase